MGSLLEITLREHTTKVLPADFPINQFVAYLDEAWANRLIFAKEDFGEEPTDNPQSTRQPFFDFSYQHEIKAKNYIGFVYWQEKLIEVVPKVFSNPDHDKTNIWNHLVYWLTYCRRIIFPFTTVNAYPDSSNSLPEALIYAFARFTNDILNQNPYSSYEEVLEESQVIKGRFNVNRYLNDQYTKGNPHVMVMNHEPFVYDNLLNRILKYVASSLNPICRTNDTYYELQRIRFLLDEVQDCGVIATDCDRVKLNRLHSDYGLVLDMCRFFLSESYLSHDSGNLQNLSFLIPMEYVFEDFIAGFLEQHYGAKYIVNYQAHNWLTDQRAFQIRHDLLLTDRVTGEKLIIDTKYKLRQPYGDNKKGISQVDMYQMVSYALRADCANILLLYPFHASSTQQPDYFTISSPMMPEKSIRLFAAEVPIVFEELSSAEQQLSDRLKYLFNFIFP
jgi:5-methylcytosine-specific restriction enzyme subunit McrC